MISIFCRSHLRQKASFKKRVTLWTILNDSEFALKDLTNWQPRPWEGSKPSMFGCGSPLAQTEQDDRQRRQMGMARALKTSRRNFIFRTSAACGLFQVVPGHVLGLNGATPPSEKLNIAGIGLGGQGTSDISQMKS